ncbi:MAG: putative transposase [Verrucomicrobiales bacterium]
MTIGYEVFWYWQIMRKTRQFVLGEPDGKSRFVHVVTRTAGQEILFGHMEKETFRKILFKQLKFSGLRALAWCFMGNHLHLLLELPDKVVSLEGWTDDDVLAKLQVFSDEFSTRMLLGEVEMFRRNGHKDGVAEIAEQVRRRLFDLSLFMKELKQRMTIAFNFKHERRGTLWEGRFKCSLVEPSAEALRAVAAYIDLNPVRAGLVERPEDYRWCSYAAAVGGMRLARSGLVSAIDFGRRSSWAKARDVYREYLFGVGMEVTGTRSAQKAAQAQGKVKPKGGFTQREIEAVWAAGGKLSMAEALRCRIRYFTDGVVLGSREFVDQFFESRKEQFGAARKSGSRRMKGAQWGNLRTLRDLKDDFLMGQSS